MKLAALLLLTTLAPATNAQFPPPASGDPNPWNGTWRLDVKRSSPAAAEPGVPQAYRFTLDPFASASNTAVAIRWEIPELGEVVTGRTDDRPMPIRRTKAAPGLALSVRAEGRSVLLYHVFKDGKLAGGGRMMLVDNGKAWVDLTWPAENGVERQELASELVYAHQV